ncbi:MAG: hypothetical protein AAF597_02975 [Bacteroidota bacterium]
MHKLGMLLMITAIGLMAFHIGYTAKTGSPDYFFLIPLGMGLMVVGMLLWYRWVLQKKKEAAEE